jgi:hypothetical protein
MRTRAASAFGRRCAERPSRDIQSAELLGYVLGLESAGVAAGLRWEVLSDYFTPMLCSCEPDTAVVSRLRQKKWRSQTPGPPNKFPCQKVNVPCNCTNRGEASAPRNDPKMLVGEATGLMIWPKVGDATSASG